MTLDEILSVRSLNFSYNTQEIFKDVDFKVNKGDYMGIVGPNGAGKSTLIKLFLGILKYDSGEINILGKSIEQFKDWTKIGYVSQKANSFNQRFPASVEEIIKYNLKSMGIKDDIEMRIEESLDLVGMKSERKKLIGNLSGGQQQRVFIAKALAQRPEIMFLDEPTVGIDYVSQEIFYEIMDKLNQKGATILMVSHDVGVINSRVSKVACVGKGNIHVHNGGNNDSIEKSLKNLYGEGINFMKHNH